MDRSSDWYEVTYNGRVCIISFPAALKHKLQDREFTASIEQAVVENNLENKGNVIIPFEYVEVDGQGQIVCPETDLLRSPPKKKISLSPSSKAFNRNDTCQSMIEATKIIDLNYNKDDVGIDMLVDNNSPLNNNKDDVGIDVLVDNNLPTDLKEVKNLKPSIIKNDFIRTYLKGTLIKNGLLSDGADLSDVITSIAPYNEANGSIVLQFSSEELAERFFSLENLYANYDRLDLKKVWKSVQICNVPKMTYDECIFTDFLKETLVRNSIMSEGRSLSNIISKVLPYNEGTESVVVEFSSPHQAAAFAELKHLAYFYSQLTLKLVSTGENKVPKNVAEPNMSAVVVKQIPPNKFKTDIFTDFLKETLVRNAIIPEGSSLSNIISKVLPYNEETESVVVEFSSPHQAAAFAELKHLEYIYSKLNLELVQSSGENKVPKNVAVPNMSAVVVKQIPPNKFKTDIFTDFLKETLVRNAIIPEGSSLGVFS